MSTIADQTFTGVTIGGDQVIEITVDGDIVWSASNTYVEAFTTVGNHTWNKPQDVDTIEVLLVGGGGGGGASENGGYGQANASAGNGGDGKYYGDIFGTI